MTGQRTALIVASDEYEHPGLRRLRSPAADASALAGVLGDPQVGGFDVRVVRNEPAHEIQALVEDLFATGQPDDVLVLHFSCHGLKNESGELFFAARNTRPNRLGSTAIPAEFIQRCMRESRSRQVVLLLDCCYGGAFGRGVSVRASSEVNVLESFPGGRSGAGRGRAVITASSSMEYAFEDDALTDDHSQQPSVFTSALVEGLASGDADRDEDGWVSLSELYEYVFDRVRERNPHQTPSRDIEMQGELYLARSGRKRVQALPVPPDLQAAMADPNMFARLGAVGELRSRLSSTNVAAAAGAHGALTQIAGGDIQYVAEAAAAALSEAAVRVSEQALDFGTVEQGSSPGPRAVRLLGPPIARACSTKPSARWMRVRETADGFEVTVDTAVTGALRGHVAVIGPTGQASVAVDVEVVPGSAPTGPTLTGPTLTDPVPTGPVMAAPAERRRDLGTSAAGLCALVGAGLLVASQFRSFRYGESMTGEDPDAASYALITAALAAAAGAATLAPRTSRLVGPGLLIGSFVVAIWGLVLLGSLATHGGLESGYWLAVAGHVVLLLAAALAALALSRMPAVRLEAIEASSMLRRLVALLAVLGALALGLQVRTLGADDHWPRQSAISAVALALVVPVLAVLARPRRLAVSLLAGWIVAATVLTFTYATHLDRLRDEQGADVSSIPIAAYAFTLVGLAVLTVRYARAPARPERAAEP